MNSYTNYHIIRINTTIQEVFMKFTNPPLPDYFCKRGYDGELTEEKLQSIIFAGQVEAESYAKADQEAAPFTPESWTGTMKQIVVDEIPEYDPNVEKLVELWEETETTRTRTLTIRPLSETELGQKARAKRAQLLAETDVEALGDRELSAEMRSYRQALRDLTDQEGWPSAIVWPTKPIG